MLNRVLLVVVVLALFGLGYVIAKTDTKPKQREEVLAYAQQLFEFGSLRFVHDRVEQDPLFDLVREGRALDKNDSCIYRKTYTEVLRKNAKIFGTLDQNIHFEADRGMDMTNNCEEHGLSGRHDLHDISARNNFEDILGELAGLDIDGSLGKIIAINDINKDLIDLIVHYAPATHALGIHDPQFALKENKTVLASLYESMVAHFKTAQFSDINSCAYWRAVDDGIADYVEIVMTAQEAISTQSSVMERKTAGGWLALQTISPRLDLSESLRPRPSDCPNN